MDYKIVFFDVDGTITNFKDGTISTGTKDAIQALTSSFSIAVQEHSVIDIVL